MQNLVLSERAIKSSLMGTRAVGPCSNSLILIKPQLSMTGFFPF